MASINGNDISGIVENLRRRGAGIVDAAKLALRDGVEEIVQDAKSRCPVKTGRLRNSIHAIPFEDGAIYKIVADAKNENGVSYAKIVEYSPESNRPFLYPALDAHKNELNAQIKRAIERSL